MVALATFGCHGYKDEATAMIAPALRDEQHTVRTAAAGLLSKLGPLPEQVVGELFTRAVELEKAAPGHLVVKWSGLTRSAPVSSSINFTEFPTTTVVVTSTVAQHAITGIKSAAFAL